MIEKITVDDRELQQALLKFYKTRSPAAVLRAQARLAAISFAFQTQPFGGSKAVGGQQDSAKRQGEGAVERDIRKTIKVPSDVYPDLEKQSVGAGRAFYAYVKTGSFDLARQMLVRLRVPGFIQTDVGQMAGRYHRSAKAPIPKRPRVPPNQKAMLITNDLPALKAYVKEVQKRVGIAKGGWAACAMQLGGTRGRMATNEAGVQQQAVPAWVKRHAGGRAQGTVVDQSENFLVGRIHMVNEVPWVDGCLSDQQAQRALDIQKERMQRAIEKALEYDLAAAGF